MATNTLSGIDVSHYQGVINWEQVSTADLSFVYVKATEGIHLVDPQFSANWAAIPSTGLLRGAYHFFDIQCDPSQQADLFINTVGALNSNDLPPVVDIESVNNSVITTTIAAALQIWLDKISQYYGRTPVIYTTNGFWNSSVGGVFANYPLWISETEVSSPRIPADWTSWSFWQSSDQGVIPGITGNVDLDSFAGTIDDLNTLR